MNRLTTGLFLVITILSALPAHALDPVDDFQRGWFSFSTFGQQVHNVEIPAYPGHAIAPHRRVILDGNGSLSKANNTNQGYPLTLEVYAAGAATVTLEYDWGYARDLTFFGLVDRIEVVVDESPQGGQITAILTDSGGSEEVALPTTGASEVLTFHLSDWNSVDPAQAEKLEFRFKSAEVRYTVPEIRFRRVGSMNVDFIGNVTATQIPPVPSPPLRFTQRDLAVQRHYKADTVVQGAVSGGPVEMNATWQAQAGATGDQGVTTFRWDESGVFADTYFTLSVDFAPAGGLIPEVYPPDPVQVDPTGFLLTFPVRVRNGGGTIVGTSNVQMLFDVDPVQGAEFTSLIVGGPFSPAAWSTGFTVSFDLVGTTGVEVHEPLFHTRWVADWVPTPTSSVPVSESARDLMITAWPGVTRGATEIRATRPFSEGAWIGVHDIGGRLLRSLRPPVGARSTIWDGAGASGADLPAGIYFLRLKDPSGTAVARVTRLR